MNHSKTIFRHEVGVRGPVQIATAKGTKLAFSDPGSTGGHPVIVCLHAIGHGGRDFAEVQKYFSLKYRVITLDWPGQGFSELDSEPVSVGRYTELFADFVDQLALKNFVILGNSIGGGVAIQYAYENPSRVTALILSNPAGLDKGGLLSKGFIWWIEKRMHTGTEMKALFAIWFSKYYREILITNESRAERNRIIASGYEIAPLLEQAWYSFRQPEGDLRSLIMNIKVPVFFAWAKYDKYVQWSRCKKAVDQFQNKKVVFFEAGHAPFLETPAIFNQEAEQFLESIAQSRRR